MPKLTTDNDTTHTLRLPSKLLDELREVAGSQGVSEAIRQGIHLWLKRERDRQKRVKG